MSNEISDQAPRHTEEQIVGHLNALGRDIIAINKANGWNVTTPADWPGQFTDALAEFMAEEPHWMPPSDDCMGNATRGYWRVFVIRARDRATVIGTGKTAQAAVDDAAANIKRDPVLTYKIPAVLALITSEVSEALEGFRKGDRANFEEEIADVMIRCLDLCAGLGIDIDAQITAKLEKNKLRGHRHGGKLV